MWRSNVLTPSLLTLLEFFSATFHPSGDQPLAEVAWQSCLIKPRLAPEAHPPKAEKSVRKNNKFIASLEA